jgi:hypothetical protein
MGSLQVGRPLQALALAGTVVVLTLNGILLLQSFGT